MKFLVLDKAISLELPSVRKSIYTYLVGTKLAMFGRDIFPELVSERIEHAVMGMDRWNAIFLQLIGSNRHQVFHSFLVICGVINITDIESYDVIF